MKNKIILLLIFINILFANTQNSQSSSVSETTQAELAKIFPKNDAVVENEACSWKCRDVNNGYVTQISGFDFKNGITYCRVFEMENLDQALIYNANKQNLNCIKNVYSGLENNAEAQKIKALSEKNKDFTSQIQYNKKENEITLSQFLSSLVTLNPDIIDRELTRDTGELTLKDGMALNSTQTIKEATIAKYGGSYEFLNFVNDTYKNITNKDLETSLFNDSYEKTTASDGFNKANMAYFSDLFLNMEKIYQHLQILLFVVVGGFYVSSIGANKLQIYLENRGESATNQPYLHKFYIPLLMVGTFFMPIPEANGLAHSTLVQKTIRYFTTQGTELADMASAVGGKTYMDKIYKSIGGINIDGINHFLVQQSINNFKSTQAEIIYKNTCSRRYEKPASTSDTLGYLKLTDKQKEDLNKIAQMDREQIAGTEYDITLEACIFLEQEINNAKRENKIIKEKLDGIIKFYQGEKKTKRLKEIDTYFAIRENQLGWINSLITPSSAILAEITSFADESINKQDMETATKKNIENNKRAVENKDVEIADGDEANDGVIGFVMGRLVWMMLPGAESVKNFVTNLYSIVQTIISSVGFFAGNIFGLGMSFITSLVKTPLIYYASSLIIEATFEKVPLLVCTTASIVAFISYLVSLCKYFYISPFVVAFSLATKRTNKIIDFLVSGISIFFKPILIVLFIYLALFVHTLVNEIFVFMSIEQFSNVKFDFYSPSNFFTNIVVSGITGMLKIFGILASSYIMWKLIVSGASWALSLVGIDGKQDDVIAQGIEANLARRAFVA